MNPVALRVREFAAKQDDEATVHILNEIAKDIENQDANPVELAPTEILINEICKRSDACLVLQYRNFPTDGESPVRLVWGPKQLPLKMAAKMCAFAHNKFMAQHIFNQPFIAPPEFEEPDEEDGYATFD
jgi:hypothetical protein